MPIVSQEQYASHDQFFPLPNKNPIWNPEDVNVIYKYVGMIANHTLEISEGNRFLYPPKRNHGLYLL